MKEKKGRMRWRWALALLAGTFAAGTATAQVNTAVVEVQITDAQSAPLPGTTVTLTATETGAQRLAVADAGGVVRFAALPPGSYRVRFELSGFTPITEENLVLRVGQTAKLQVTLQEARQEEIVVTATAPLVDVFKTDSSTTIVPEQIAYLPVPDRDFQKLAFTAPGVSRERGTFRYIESTPVLGAGGNASQATIMVDGVDFTDPSLGLARARFSQDAIREFRVITNRFDTEIGQSAGGALSIVTRSGGNDLAGTAFGFYRADELREPGALEQDNLPFKRTQFGFTLGGAITRDRFHYFLSAEQINEDNIALFRPKGAFAAQAADVDHPFDQTLGFAALDYTLGEAQRFAGRLVWERYEEENFRVGLDGGVRSPENGMTVKRNNWNLTGEHVWVVSAEMLNELRLQTGRRKYENIGNSTAMGEWFSSGVTLRTGANESAGLLGDNTQYELRETFRLFRGNHSLKLGTTVTRIEDRFDFPVFKYGLMVYVGDSRALPLAYNYGVGSGDVTIKNTLYGAFIQDDWTVVPGLTLNLGVRYDLDMKGNNPGFEHPLITERRKRDTDNVQPRLGFSWDVTGRGSSVLRGGAGRFTGRYLLVPAFTELQQNGVTGRVLLTRLNGALLGLPPAFWLDPNNPQNTGVLLPKNASLIANQLEAPESDQFTLGFTQKLGRTGLYVDVEGIYVEGSKEIFIRDRNFGGNANPVRPNPAWSQINTYGNEGHSKYKALVASLNGVLKGGHIVTAAVTFADKKNLSDDFSPAFPDGYPSDPADPEGEWGRARGHERMRIVATGVFRLPWLITVAPIVEYGTGQPWTHRLGYDYNGDGKNSDRPAGIKRNSMEGPIYRSVSLRLTKGFAIAGAGTVEVIAEAFNLFDHTNYNVNTVDSAEFLSGPTVTNRTAPYVRNPNFGKYAATFAGREIQLGLRYSF